jgi:hypothetical protein
MYNCIAVFQIVFLDRSIVLKTFKSFQNPFSWFDYFFFFFAEQINFNDNLNKHLHTKH